MRSNLIDLVCKSSIKLYYIMNLLVVKCDLITYKTIFINYTKLIRTKI